MRRNLFFIISVVFATTFFATIFLGCSEGSGLRMGLFPDSFSQNASTTPNPTSSTGGFAIPTGGGGVTNPFPTSSATPFPTPSPSTSVAPYPTFTPTPIVPFPFPGIPATPSAPQPAPSPTSLSTPAPTSTAATTNRTIPVIVSVPGERPVLIPLPTTPTEAPSPAPTSTPTSCAATPNERAELHPSLQRVVQVTNALRKHHGLAPLRINARLSAAAQAYAERMYRENYFEHTSSDGLSFTHRISQEGYSWRYCGENIARFYPDADSVMRAWIDSPSHFANLIHTAYSEIGVGFYGSANSFYWVQEFGTPKE